MDYVLSEAIRGHGAPLMRLAYFYASRGPTGYTDNSILGGQWHGRAAFLEKPFSPNTLLIKVRDMLDGTSFYHRHELERGF